MMERDVKRIRRVWNRLIWIVVGKGKEKLHQHAHASELGVFFFRYDT